MNLDLTIYTKELLWWLSGKESTCKAGDMGSIPGWGRSLEEGMTTYSSILVWRIPWTEEPGGLQSMGSQRVGHDWATNTFRLNPPYYWASLLAPSVKNLSARQETQVLFLSQEDPLVKGMATHSSILAWRIPWTEDPGRYSPCGHIDSDMTEVT